MTDCVKHRFTHPYIGICLQCGVGVSEVISSEDLARLKDETIDNQTEIHELRSELQILRDIK